MQTKALNSVRIPVDFVDALSHANSVESVLALATRWLPHFMPSDRSAICMFDHEDLIIQISRKDGEIEEWEEDLIKEEEAPHRPILEGGGTLRLDFDAVGENDGYIVRRMRDMGFKEAILSPMRSNGQTVGTISISSRVKGVYTQMHEEKLLFFGKLLAAQARLRQAARDSVRMAETDALTGLANRARLMRVLDGPAVLHKTDKFGRVLGLLHIDLDHFKEVNDTYGHAVGDAVICHAASAMQDTVSAKDLVARVGGDEFVIVTRTDPKGKHLETLGRRLCNAITRPVQIDGIKTGVGASIGAAMATAPATTADDLIRNADVALYEVKRNGRGGIRTYNASLHRSEGRRRKLLADMQNAIEAQAFHPFFQPLVSLSTGHFSGFEMLARWDHPEHGFIEPEEFLQLAAEAGRSDQIDAAVRNAGIKSLRMLRDDGWDAPKMSFNASARTIGTHQLVDQLKFELGRYDMTPKDLVIEVREAELLELGEDVASERIKRLVSAGFELELDDFGAGYGSITTLARYPFAGVKLDPSMIVQLEGHTKCAVACAAISLAHDLGLRVSAKGVENQQQFETLRQIGCDDAQGFGISKPLPFEELIAFMSGYDQSPVELAGG